MAETSTVTDVETVGYTDARWAQLGVTMRQVDVWTRSDILRTVGVSTPGTGRTRRWPVSELDVAGRIVRLLAAGFTLSVAKWVAREQEPTVEIADGITITVLPVDALVGAS